MEKKTVRYIILLLQHRLLWNTLLNKAQFKVAIKHKMNNKINLYIYRINIYTKFNKKKT